MARTTGPLMSLGASGSIGGALTFATWKGRPYVRQLVTPANPKSDKQTSVRSMMRFLSQAWAGLDALAKASWDALAAANAHSAFNAYTSDGMTRWASLNSPGQAFPVGGTGVAGTLGTQAAIGGIREATIEVTLSALADNWGCQLHRATVASFAPSYSTLVGVIPTPDNTKQTWVDTPLEPGTYFYRLIPFTKDGLTGAPFAEINAIVN